MRKKQINIISHLYPPSVGGVERHSFNMAKELAAKGFSVNIITTNSHFPSGLAQQDKINVYSLSSMFVVERRFPIPYNPIQIFRIFKNFYSKDSFTIIQTRLFLTSFIGVVLAALSGSKAIIIEHGSGHLEYKSKIINKIFEWYEHFFTFILKLFSPDFYAVSKSGSEWLKHFGIKSKGEIYNGINTAGFDEAIVPSQLSSFREKKIITYLGRLIPEKGVLELIKAFNKLKDNSLVLVIAGKGELDTVIQQSAAKNKNIEFLGMLEHQEALGLLKNTSIFVNPSNYPEGLPTILLEAGYLELPVISTPNGGAKEVIKHLNTGYVIYKGESSEIELALTYMLQNYSDALEMGKNLKKEIKTNYVWSEIISKLIQIIEA